MMHYLFSFALLLAVYVSQAQTTTGRLIDQSTETPIPDALIFTASDTSITDADGYFRIPSKMSGPIKVQILGYETKILQNMPESSMIYLNPSAISLNEVTISAGITRDKIKNTAGAVSLVSKRMIQRDAPYSITNALNRVPGLYMHSGTYSTNRITIRGIGSRSLFGTTKIKAYYGQIPLTDGSGNSIIEDIDQSLIDRIEVLKGPNSSVFGAGLAGVVRLYPDKPAPNATTLQSSLNVGSFNRLRWSTQFSHSDDKKSVSATYTKVKSDGYRENSEYDRDQAGIITNWTIGKKGKLSFLGIYTHLKAYIPSALNLDDYTNNPEIAASNWAAAKGFKEYDKYLTGLSYEHEIGGSWNLSSSVFFNYHDAYEPRPFDILDEETSSLGTRNILTGKFKKITASAGFEWFYDIYQWGTFTNTAPDAGSAKGDARSDYEENRMYYNLFAEVNLDVSARFKLIGGLNVNQTQYDLRDRFNEGALDESGFYEFDMVLSPRLGGVYHLDLSHHLYTNISHGFSPPTLEETLQPDGRINPEIKPESGWNYELGARGNIRSLSYDLVGYFMDIRNLLVAQRTGDDQYYGVNAGVNHHVGIDLLLNYLVDVSENYQLNFFNSTSYMHYRFAEFIDEEEDYSGNQLTGVPEFIMNAGVELLSDNGVYANINGQYVGKIPITDANSLYSDSYFVLRSKVGYAFRVMGLEVDLHVGADNLLNEKYAGMLLINNTAFGSAQPRYYYPGDPRNFFTGVKVNYSF